MVLHTKKKIFHVNVEIKCDGKIIFRLNNFKIKYSAIFSPSLEENKLDGLVLRKKVD